MSSHFLESETIDLGTYLYGLFRHLLLPILTIEFCTPYSKLHNLTCSLFDRWKNVSFTPEYTAV